MARIMSQEQQTILMFKGLIASLPQEQQVMVREAEKKLRDVLVQYPDGEGLLAFGLIGAEAQADI